MISESTINKVRELSIEDVLEPYVRLSRKGSTLMGVCPFHEERTGSFSVSPGKNLFHCFSCNRGGDAITFIMEKENLQCVLQESASLEEMTPIPDESRIGGADNVMQDAFEEEKANLRLQMEQENWESVKKEVLTIVSRRYLEPSLKRVEVIRDVSMMNHTLAGTFITQVGFYKLVNAFRVRHYEKLMESSAGTYGQEAAAELCGFKNRWALTNARKRLGDFDYSLIEDYI